MSDRETPFDITTPRTTAECYAEELDRQVGDYGPDAPDEDPHEAYAKAALRAGAAALRSSPSPQWQTETATPLAPDWTLDASDTRHPSVRVVSPYPQRQEEEPTSAQRLARLTVERFAAGWDEDGLTGVKAPYRWETAARVCLDILRSIAGDSPAPPVEPSAPEHDWTNPAFTPPGWKAPVSAPVSELLSRRRELGHMTQTEDITAESAAIDQQLSYAGRAPFISGHPPIGEDHAPSTAAGMAERSRPHPGNLDRRDDNNSGPVMGVGQLAPVTPEPPRSPKHEFSGGDPAKAWPKACGEYIGYEGDRCHVCAWTKDEHGKARPTTEDATPDARPARTLKDYTRHDSDCPAGVCEGHSDGTVCTSECMNGEGPCSCGLDALLSGGAK